MKEVNKCTHLDFNKSYGCSCSADAKDMKKTRYAEVYMVDTNIAAVENAEKDK